MLYYRPRMFSNIVTSKPAAIKPRPATQIDRQRPAPSMEEQPTVHNQPPEPYICKPISNLPTIPRVILRIHRDYKGRCEPYDFFSIWPHICQDTTTSYDWFGYATGRSKDGPSSELIFTLINAMPHLTKHRISIRAQGEFSSMKSQIVRQFEKAQQYMPGLTDFTVVVTDPG